MLPARRPRAERASPAAAPQSSAPAPAHSRQRGTPSRRLPAGRGNCFRVNAGRRSSLAPAPRKALPFASGPPIGPLRLAPPTAPRGHAHWSASPRPPVTWPRRFPLPARKPALFGIRPALSPAPSRDTPTDPFPLAPPILSVATPPSPSHAPGLIGSRPFPAELPPLSRGLSHWPASVGTAHLVVATPIPPAPARALIVSRPFPAGSAIGQLRPAHLAVATPPFPSRRRRSLAPSPRGAPPLSRGLCHWPASVGPAYLAVATPLSPPSPGPGAGAHWLPPPSRGLAHWPASAQSLIGPRPARGPAPFPRTLPLARFGLAHWPASVSPAHLAVATPLSPGAGAQSLPPLAGPRPLPADSPIGPLRRRRSLAPAPRGAPPLSRGLCHWPASVGPAYLAVATPLPLLPAPAAALIGSRPFPEDSPIGPLRPARLVVATPLSPLPAQALIGPAPREATALFRGLCHWPASDSPIGRLRLAPPIRQWPRPFPLPAQTPALIGSRPFPADSPIGPLRLAPPLPPLPAPTPALIGSLPARGPAHRAASVSTAPSRSPAAGAPGASQQ
ncbi:basic proline-rich protein-like [Tachyglossus aculeatus]|uniref:basic proline-rich protein-like n=1 Tax=Tachyglossus aculeatus TaxID=9261 RepID=UPI0018F58D19|nr:basic proline-rich protein-like [Tachyglossus aculeatus]